MRQQANPYARQILVLKEYVGSGVTREQFVAIFKASGFKHGYIFRSG
jgi:hypothetical protein